MAASGDTKIFGVKIGVDPKLLVAGLVAVAALLFWFNSGSGEESATRGGVSSTRGDTATAAQPAAVRPRAGNSARRTHISSDSGSLRLRPIDPTRGDVDPTLRLDLLARLQNAHPEASGRSLFEVGPAPLSAAEQKLLKNPPVVPKIQPAVAATPAPPAEPVVNIPLKYYGFAKPDDTGDANQGLFLDGDNVVVATEGETILRRYLVVSLTPTSARLEDTQLKKGQTLSVVPAATTP